MEPTQTVAQDEAKILKFERRSYVVLIGSPYTPSYLESIYLGGERPQIKITSDIQRARKFLSRETAALFVCYANKFLPVAGRIEKVWHQRMNQ